MIVRQSVIRPAAAGVGIAEAIPPLDAAIAAIQVPRRHYVVVDWDEVQLDRTYLRLKRALDIAFSLLLLPPVGLVVGLSALAIRLDSPGRIFFRQRRVGMRGERFEMLKLRSMRENNDASMHRDAIVRFMRGETLNAADPEKNPFKLGDDPRITRVGKVLRKLSIDELPQFWNVLTGKMSLVGPRPALPYEVEMYGPDEWLRFAGKPGLTGPWQVYARGKARFDEMVDLDVEYLRTQSIWQDLKLIFLTVPVMLFGRGGA